MKFPKDAPKHKVVKTFEALEFKIIRMGNHISLVKENKDNTKIPLTIPNHDRIKGSTLRTICRQSGISREDFLKIYRRL